MPFTAISPSFLRVTEDPLSAGACLDSGALLFYPTETFFALGCRSSDRSNIDQIIKLKRRPSGKCLPLIAANLEQAARYCDLSAAPPDLISRFWPGPLTLILPALLPLHPALLDQRGRIAIRVSASPLARSLARQCNEPLISSSANISGQKPAHLPENLDPQLLRALEASKIPACLLAQPCPPGDGKASTIIESRRKNGKWRLRILREGLITEKALQVLEHDII